jgi:hypothetical protein
MRIPVSGMTEQNTQGLAATFGNEKHVTHVFDTEICFHAPHTGSTAGKDECRSNAKCFERV